MEVSAHQSAVLNTALKLREVKMMTAKQTNYNPDSQTQLARQGSAPSTQVEPQKHPGGDRKRL